MLESGQELNKEHEKLRFIIGLTSNLPQSWPVSLNASGGTPLTKRGKPFLFCQINRYYFMIKRYNMLQKKRKVRSHFRDIL